MSWSESTMPPTDSCATPTTDSTRLGSEFATSKMLKEILENTPQDTVLFHVAFVQSVPVNCSKMSQRLLGTKLAPLA